ncbi:MAG: hypothetical protein IJ569_08030, partial [Prevotella sp.]|nr:hypothetical protein [Prevotella sp.]
YLLMRTKSLVRNTMLSIGLVVVVLLRLLLWPIRQLRSAVGRLLPKGRKNKGLGMSARWMLSKWVTL